MPLIFVGNSLLFSNGAPAMSTACCCTDVCCGACPWLSDYYVATGQFKATFTSGPISGYIILSVTGITQQNACLEWQTSDDSNVVDPCGLYAGGTVVFWCEETGVSATPLRFSIGGIGSAMCEVIYEVDPELIECTDAVAPDPYGTLTIRSRWALNELAPGACAGCGGVPQDIVIEITRHP